MALSTREWPKPNGQRPITPCQQQPCNLLYMCYVYICYYIYICLCHHCHSSSAPSYVADIQHKKPSRTRITRPSSYTMPLLNRPAHSKATLGDRSFSLASSSDWNSIPNDVRNSPSLSSSKSRLKTYLFRSGYKD